MHSMSQQRDLILINIKNYINGQKIQCWAQHSHFSIFSFLKKSFIRVDLKGCIFVNIKKLLSSKIWKKGLIYVLVWGICRWKFFSNQKIIKRGKNILLKLLFLVNCFNCWTRETFKVPALQIFYKQLDISSQPGVSKKSWKLSLEVAKTGRRIDFLMKKFFRKN